MKPWLRNALTFGAGAAVVTLVLNLVGNATASGDACHRNSPLGILAFLFFLGLVFSGARIFRRRGSRSGGSRLWRSRSGRLGLRRGFGGTEIRAGLGRSRRAVQSDEESQNKGQNGRAAHETSRPFPLRRWADTISIPANESPVGGGRTRFAQVGKS